jgi:hypothetical protein
MSSSSPRETIQISFGPTSNAITSHLVNLQGLACTTNGAGGGNRNDDYDTDAAFITPYCDPLTTHYVQRQYGNSNNGTWVPRILLIDEATHHVPDNIMVDGDASAVEPSMTNNITTGPSLGAPWNGRVQNLVGTARQPGPDDTAAAASSSDSSYFAVASALAYSPYSRYQHRGGVEQSESDVRMRHSSYRSTSFPGPPPHSDNYAKNSSSSSGDDPRHVLWDDEGDEEEEEDEEERRDRLARLRERERLQRLEWQMQTAVTLRYDLERLTEQRLLASSSLSPQVPAAEAPPPPPPLLSVPSSKSESTTSSSGVARRRPNPIQWTDIWMPPRSEKSRLILPYSSQSQLVPHWDVIYSSIGGGGNNNSADPPFLKDWKQDVLGESLRHILEGCDYGIQGATLTAEGTGIYASLTSFLLDELHEECKSAVRMVYHVQSNNNPTAFGKNAISREEDGDGGEPSWQQAQVRRVREGISSGLALCDFAHKAHAILPLRLDNDENAPNQIGTMAWFQATAQVAMALEGCTLPYRFQGRSDGCGGTCYNEGRPNYQMGLQNAPFMARHGTIADTAWGGTAPALTMAEYLAMLQPSSSHCMLELDTIATTGWKGPLVSSQEFFQAIQEGTSVERDYRMQERGEQACRSRPQQALPGAWLQDRRRNSTGECGFLSSLSYSAIDQGVASNGKSNGGELLDRSAHHHFSLSTSVRALPLQKKGDAIALSNHVTCLIESMGVRYRPERSMGVVVNQTIGRLTFGGNESSVAYGAGVYWKHILPAVATPVVAVLGNTTRAYYSLNRIATDMKSAMRNHRFRGYYNRDVMNGVLPELEDCDGALECCLEKRDIYQPPAGAAGLNNDD